MSERMPVHSSNLYYFNIDITVPLFFFIIFSPHSDSGVHRTWLNHLGASAYVKVAAQDNGVPQSYNWGSC